MDLINKIILILLLIIFIPVAYAKDVQQNTKQWDALKLTGQFAKDSHWAYLAELHARFGVNTENFDQGLTRLGIGYYMTPDISLWGGYVYTVTSNDDTQHENRLWQQLSWRIVNCNYWQLTSRNRFEQRKRLSEANISWRFREKVQLTSPGFFTHKVRPLIADEVFFNLNNTAWTGNRTIPQNRFIIGLLFYLTKHMSLETDYMNQYKFRSAEDEMNHVLVLSLNISPSSD